MRRLAAGLIVLALGGFAPAEEAPYDHPPEWIRKPSPEDFISAWPLQAAKTGTGGSARITCTVEVTGLLSRCRVDTEEPVGAGFGTAALLLAPSFLMRPPMRDGKPVEGGQVTIPIRFTANGQLVSDLTTRSRIAEKQKGVEIARALPWFNTPTARDIAMLYPARSADLKGPALVVFQCAVRRDGVLFACETVAENPKGGGFAPAGRMLTRKFRANLEGIDDARLARLRINLPIAFLGPDYDSRTRVLTKPTWTRSLDPGKVQALFPARAADAGLKTGRAELDCVVDADGILTACQATSEEPAGMDFGLAGVRVASALAVNLWTESGEPAQGAHLRFAIRFNKAEPATP